MEKRTLAFQFDEAAYEHIQKVKKDRGYSTEGEVVGDSLRIQEALQSEEKQGFNQILVRNPRTRETRILTFPGR